MKAENTNERTDEQKIADAIGVIEKRCQTKGKKMNCTMNGTSAGCGSIYGLAFIGSLIYFLQHADTFGAGLLGVLNAIAWPGVLVYHLLEFLKM